MDLGCVFDGLQTTLELHQLHLVETLVARGVARQLLGVVAVVLVRSFQLVEPVQDQTFALETDRCSLYR